MMTLITAIATAALPSPSPNADCWNERIDDWTYAAGVPSTEQFGV